MNCLQIAVGIFPNDVVWLGGPGAANGVTASGVTVKNVVGMGTLDGVHISNGTDSVIFYKGPPANRTSFAIFGTPANYVLAAKHDSAFVTVSVSVFDVSGAMIKEQSLGPITATELPVVGQSLMNGNLFVIMYTNNGEQRGMICRSDNGQILCNAVPFMPGGVAPVRGEAINTAALPRKLRIIDGGGNVRGIANWPIGESVAGDMDFGTVVIGPGTTPPQNISTRTGKIKNTGVDCMTIAGVSDNAPYSIVPNSYIPAIPAGGSLQLKPNEEITFTVLFNPATTAGSPFNRDLTINPVPAAGDKKISCTGKARPVSSAVTITSMPLDFGITRVFKSFNKSLTIDNTGDVPVTLLGVSLPTGADFTWVPPAVGTVFAKGQQLVNINVTFTPQSVGAKMDQIRIQTNASNFIDVLIPMNGVGCLPVPRFQTASFNPVDLGSVQQGFRTVRQFSIRNNGSGILQFSARIRAALPGDPVSQAAAAQYGLLNGMPGMLTPVTNPLSLLSGQQIAPLATNTCDVTPGTGEMSFGICFFANSAPGIAVNALLELFDHNDPSQSAVITVNLSAMVTAPVAVDIELVLDRSGSMSAISGSRTRIDTALDAANLFVELMRPDGNDRLGLVRFNDTPELVRFIEPVTPVTQPLMTSLLNTTVYAPSGGTCIAGGVLVAIADMAAHPLPRTPLNRVILVLTDGFDNVKYLNPTDGQYYSIHGGTLLFDPTPTIPLPPPPGIKVYAIGIGDDIDAARLGELAVSSGGAFLHAREFNGLDYFNLEKHFTQVFMEAKDFALIDDPVFWLGTGETHTYYFEVLTGDPSAIVVVYDRDQLRLPFFIETPGGELIDPVSIPAGFQARSGISTTARFIEIIMPDSEPERYAGTWKVTMRHDGRACYHRPQKQAIKIHKENFRNGFQPLHCEPVHNAPILYGIAIGAKSNFHLHGFITPAAVFAGHPIPLTARLIEFGLPVKGGKISVDVTTPSGKMSSHQLYDDGLHGDDEANDGVYGFAYPHTLEQGSYTFTFTATAPSREGTIVKRQTVRSKLVQSYQTPYPPITGAVSTSKDCCSSIRRWLWLIAILVFLALVVLILIWRQQQ